MSTVRREKTVTFWIALLKLESLRADRCREQDSVPFPGLDLDFDNRDCPFPATEREKRSHVLDAIQTRIRDSLLLMQAASKGTEPIRQANLEKEPSEGDSLHPGRPSTRLLIKTVPF